MQVLEEKKDNILNKKAINKDSDKKEISALNTYLKKLEKKRKLNLKIE